ncbi:MAG: mechanosensitive ion channel domain-containing protein [Candidatus Saccharibacteria bacterium]
MVNLIQLISSNTSPSQLIPKISTDIFNWHSILVLVVVMFIAWFLGKITSSVLRQLSVTIGHRVDKTKNLAKVNQLRRLETMLILATALARTLFVVIGLYAWWALTHPTQLTALIGVGALLLLMLSNLSSPIFRDIALGGGMIAEKWYGVGDLVTLWPNGMQGIVEHVTLRSTRIRKISGEVVWVSNQNIAMVEVLSKGAHPIAIELFVSDKSKAEKLIESTNKLIPMGMSLVISPLTIMEDTKIDDTTRHLTVIAETAPWREDLITTSAVKILKDLDDKHSHHVLLSDPIARVADRESEKQFARVINNSRKTLRTKRLANLAVRVADRHSNDV